jgi:hypothetical protein
MSTDDSPKYTAAQDVPVSRVEFEAALMRQEHRLHAILRNFFILRRQFPEGASEALMPAGPGITAGRVVEPCGRRAILREA